MLNRIKVVATAAAVAILVLVSAPAAGAQADDGQIRLVDPETGQEFVIVGGADAPVTPTGPQRPEVSPTTPVDSSTNPDNTLLGVVAIVGGFAMWHNRRKLRPSRIAGHVADRGTNAAVSVFAFLKRAAVTPAGLVMFSIAAFSWMLRSTVASTGMIVPVLVAIGCAAAVANHQARNDIRTTAVLAERRAKRAAATAQAVADVAEPVSVGPDAHAPATQVPATQVPVVDDVIVPDDVSSLETSNSVFEEPAAPAEGPGVGVPHPETFPHPDHPAAGNGRENDELAVTLQFAKKITVLTEFGDEVDLDPDVIRRAIG